MIIESVFYGAIEFYGKRICTTMQYTIISARIVIVPSLVGPAEAMMRWLSSTLTAASQIAFYTFLVRSDPAFMSIISHPTYKHFMQRYLCVGVCCIPPLLHLGQMVGSMTWKGGRPDLWRGIFRRLMNRGF